MDSIKFESVNYIYGAGTPMAKQALFDVDLAIPTGQVTAIIGHTGSGKSTLLQHLNVLVRPTRGTVTIDGRQVTATSKERNLKRLRKKVGVVFQFPEAQLFEETVLKDVMFGPLNFEVAEEEAERIAREKLGLVGIKEELFERSPFDLSGGQMRRVAIAGVLALEPEILVLDEPTAGLDPLGHIEMMEMFLKLKEEQDLTLVLVTHQMDDVATYAEHVIVLEKGRVIKTGSPEDIFQDSQWLVDHQLGLPQSVAFLEEVTAGMDLDLQPAPALTVDELADELITLMEGADADAR